MCVSDKGRIQAVHSKSGHVRIYRACQLFGYSMVGSSDGSCLRLLSRTAICQFLCLCETCDGSAETSIGGEQFSSRLLSVSLSRWVECQLLLGICIAGISPVHGLARHWTGDSKVSHRS